MAENEKPMTAEEVALTIITYSGVAKSNAIEAMRLARVDEFKQANDLIDEAVKSLQIAEQAHFDVITLEAQGQKADINVLYIHAEDQMLTTQMMIEVAKELILTHKRISDLTKK